MQSQATPRRRHAAVPAGAARPAGAGRVAGGGRRPGLAHELVAALTQRIESGRLADGDRLPTEAELVAEFGVSRTVVREAISRLQASGLVETRHGVGTFVAAAERRAAFRITPEQLATLQDVIAMLELRMGVETEAAGLAALRRTEAQLKRMRGALAEFGRAVAAGRDAVEADFRFHQEVAQATQNAHFADLLGTLGLKIIPRARLEPAEAASPERLAYLQRVHGEHESIYNAIAAGDAEAARAAMRTHLANSRERRRRAALPAAPGAGSAPRAPQRPRRPRQPRPAAVV